MVYLEYDIRTKQVVEIHDAEPTVTADYDFAKSEQFAVGDEFEQTIWINEVDENKNILSYSAIRNNPNAKRLLEENSRLKDEIINLKSITANLAYSLMVGGIIQ
jgi:hypothetical protein